MGGERYRNANPEATRPHSLKSKVKGKNRFQPGEYVCSCGETFPGIAAFQKHRGSARKSEKALATSSE